MGGCWQPNCLLWPYCSPGKAGWLLVVRRTVDKENKGQQQGPTPLGNRHPQLPVLRQQDESWALPESALLPAPSCCWHCLALLPPVGWECPVLPSASPPPLVSVSQQITECCSPLSSARQGEGSVSGGAGTEVRSFIKTSNKASRCLGRDSALVHSALECV